jgi:hypothetical protein
MSLDIYINQHTDSDPITITCQDETGAIYPLAGYTAFAHVRKCLCGASILDLAPTIDANDTAGVITIPSVTFAVAKTINSGTYSWDLILQKPDGTRLPPIIISGNFVVCKTATQPT